MEETRQSPEAALLAEVPFFQLLDNEERQFLASELDIVRFKAGDTIFTYGDPGDSLFVIRTGEVEVFFKDDTGERIVLETDREGDFFGELSLLDNGPRTASVVAPGTSKLCGSIAAISTTSCVCTPRPPSISSLRWASGCA